MSMDLILKEFEVQMKKEKKCNRPVVRGGVHSL